MAAVNHQKIKLLMMVELLRQKTSKENPLSTNELVDEMEKLGISLDRRTLSKDVALLNEFGYEVKSRQVGYQKGYYMGNANFSLSELKILMDAVQAASFVTDSQTKALVSKIADLGGSHRAEILKENIICFNTTKHTNDRIYENVAELERALNSKKQASFYYFDRDEDGKKVYRKEKKRYVVEPMALIFNDDNYYLMTWSSKYDGITNYRVDRMDEVAVEEDDVSDKAKMDDSDIAAFTEQAFKMYGGDLVDITVEFNDKLIGVIQDKFGEDTKIVRTGTNKCVAPIQVQVSPTFWGWIFQFGTDMRILSPETLSDEYKKRASDIANM